MTGAERVRSLLADVEAKARRTAWRAVRLPDGQIVRGESAWRSLLRVWSQKPGLRAAHLLESLQEQLEVPAAALPNLMVDQAVLVARADGPIDDDADDWVHDSLPASAREFEIFCQAVRWAQARGLRVHPCQVNWFARSNEDYELNYGFMHHDASGVPDVWLQLGLSNDQLLATALHELKHVDDLLRLGRRKFLDIPKAEREQRAYAFEHQVMWEKGRL